jgi:arylsulfatase A-like enzyme
MDVFATVEAATQPHPDAALADAAPADAAATNVAGAGATNAAALTYAADGGRVRDGVDLIPYVTGEREGDPHEALFWRSFYNHAVRSGPWKLIVQEAGSPGADADIELLFNLETDPGERENVAALYPEVVERLREQFEAWERGLSPPLWPPVMHFWMEVWGSRYWFAI